MKVFCAFLVVLFTVSTQAQDIAYNAKYTDVIKKSHLKKHVYALAADSLEGRGTGQPGITKAARYIAAQFEEIGLHPFNDSTFFQPLPLWQWHWGDCFVESNNQQLSNHEEMVYLSNTPIDSITSAQCVFVGYGDHLEGMDLKGKVAFAFVKNLRSWYQISNRLKKKEIKALFIANPENNKQFDVIKAQHQQFSGGRRVYKEYPTFSGYQTKTFAFDAHMAQTLFGLPIDSLRNIKLPTVLSLLPKPYVKFQCPVIVEEFTTDNIIGYLPGTTKNNETLILTAHYDHIGINANHIFPGADDNASGTAALLEVARALSALPEVLSKHIVFLATTAEEKGLLGAQYFVNHPEFHSFDLKANINIDMIGRRDSAHKENYIYLIGTRHHPEFMTLHQKANTLIDPLTLDYAYDNQTGFGNFLNLSDHYAFHKNNIPIIAFFGGLHKDYHKTSDTPDKIEFKEMTHRVRLIFATAFLAAQKSAFND